MDNTNPDSSAFSKKPSKKTLIILALILLILVACLTVFLFSQRAVAPAVNPTLGT